MRHLIDVPDYDPEQGVSTKWEEGSNVSVTVSDGETVIRANVAGLRSLARHCLALAQDGVPEGRHLHLDEWSGLAAGSAQVTLERG